MRRDPAGSGTFDYDGVQLDERTASGTLLASEADGYRAVFMRDFQDGTRAPGTLLVLERPSVLPRLPDRFRPPPNGRMIRLFRHATHTPDPICPCCLSPRAAKGYPGEGDQKGRP